jgi:hypothetical protein
MDILPNEFILLTKKLKTLVKTLLLILKMIQEIINQGKSFFVLQ